MWCFCDDGGVHPASVKSLKMQVFPSDEITTEQVSAWINELIDEELLYAYSAMGKEYWLVTGWFSHQKIDRPSYRYPMPNGTVPTTRYEAEQWSRIRRAVGEHSTSPRRVIPEPPSNQSPNSVLQHVDNQQFDERSTNGRRGLDEGHPPESSRMESKGEESSKSPPTPSPGPRPPTGEPQRVGNIVPAEKLVPQPSGYHAVEFHPRYNEVREYIVKRLPKLARQNATEVNRWLLEGADPEKDIFPSVDHAIDFKRGDIGSFKYFTRAIESSVQARKEVDEQYQRLSKKFADQDAGRSEHAEAE
jgi:hypothetical protein